MTIAKFFLCLITIGSIYRLGHHGPSLAAHIYDICAAVFFFYLWAELCLSLLAGHLALQVLDIKQNCCTIILLAEIKSL